MIFFSPFLPLKHSKSYYNTHKMFTFAAVWVTFELVHQTKAFSFNTSSNAITSFQPYLAQPVITHAKLITEPSFKAAAWLIRALVIDPLCLIVEVMITRLIFIGWYLISYILFLLWLCCLLKLFLEGFHLLFDLKVLRNVLKDLWATK